MTEELKIALAQLNPTVGDLSGNMHKIREAHKTAREQGADLIIVGSHGRHGLALLLGSTANGVLHGASCDVLAVRVGNPD